MINPWILYYSVSYFFWCA